MHPSRQSPINNIKFEISLKQVDEIEKIVSHYIHWYEIHHVNQLYEKPRYEHQYCILS